MSMHNLEVMNMAMSKERALVRDPRRLEQRRHRHEALAHLTRSAGERLGPPRFFWRHIMDRLRAQHSRRAPHIAPGCELATEHP
jgi:hypothetical protein